MIKNVLLTTDIVVRMSIDHHCYVYFIFSIYVYNETTEVDL